MAEKPEDLNLPTAVITRMIKEVLPDGVNVSKEAKAAISKSASVFVLYATSCANNIALQHKRKTLTAGDVLEAVEEMEFPTFIKPLKESLEVVRREQKEKKDAAEMKKKKKADKEQQQQGGEKKTNGTTTSTEEGKEKMEEASAVNAEAIADEAAAKLNGADVPQSMEE